MNYSAIGLMSGSSLDGLDIVYATFKENDSKWSYKVNAAACFPFSSSWKNKLKNAVKLNASDYLLLHSEFGKYNGEKVNEFLRKNLIKTKIDVIGSHGHTTFHLPAKNMTHQLGEGASIAATTKIQTVSDLRNMDVALNGQGAPIVPVGEKLLFPEYRYFLNIGGICNVSIHEKKSILAFDVCPANRVLNMLSNELGKQYDKGGNLARSGRVIHSLLEDLNALKYYSGSYPKSLPNSFGTDVIYPMLKISGVNIYDAMATFSEHIAQQLMKSLVVFQRKKVEKMLITGGGAFNSYVIERIQYYLQPLGIEAVVPGHDMVNYKEALIMSLIAVLRLREEANVLATVTGAKRNSCGGALWSVK